MKRLYKKALIDLAADDMRLNKDEEVELNDLDLDFLDELDEKSKDKKPDLDKDIDLDKKPELDLEPTLPLVEKPEFEQPPVTPEMVDSQFGVEDPGMGIDMVSLDQGLLNDLASLQTFYQQVKLFHWIFNGENYIATHEFLDEVAEAVLEEIDLLAERMVFLGIDPVADHTQIANLSYIEFVQMNQNFKFASLITLLDNDLTTIVNSLKDNSIRAGESKDIGTSKMLEDFVYDLEVLQHHIRSFR